MKNKARKIIGVFLILICIVIPNYLYLYALNNAIDWGPWFFHATFILIAWDGGHIISMLFVIRELIKNSSSNDKAKFKGESK